jgi:hypothetical protein
VKQHFLASYRSALTAILRAQFSLTKAFVEGRAGALRLAANPAVHAYLCHAGVALFPALS